MIDYHDYREAVFASDLTTQQKIVALAISYHFNWKYQGPAYPSNKTLARETSLAVSTIVKAKRVLVKRGFITSNQRFNNSSEYTCNIPEQLVCSQIEPNNEYNNEYNNEKDNQTSFDNSINNINQGDVTISLETNAIVPFDYKEIPAGAAAPKFNDKQIEEMLSW